MSKRFPKVAQICGVPGWGLRRLDQTHCSLQDLGDSVLEDLDIHQVCPLFFEISTTRCWNPIHCDARCCRALYVLLLTWPFFRPKQKQSHGLTSSRTCLIHVVADWFGIQFLCCDHACSWRPQGSTWRTTSYQRCAAAIRFTKSSQ